MELGGDLHRKKLVTFLIFAVTFLKIQDSAYNTVEEMMILFNDKTTSMVMKASGVGRKRNIILMTY